MTSSLECKLNKLINDVHALEKDIVGAANSVISGKDLEPKIGKQMDAISIEARNSDANLVQNIVNKYSIDIIQLHHILVGYTYKNERVLRGEHDRFMSALGIGTVKQRFKRLPTQLYERFVKRIYMFDTIIPTGLQTPSYHRDGSCGDKQLPLDVKFTKPEHVHDLVQCIVERKIYDAIYTKTFYAQDIGGFPQLERLERRLESFEKGASVNVFVMFDERSKPIGLKVAYITDHVVPKVTETYEHNYPQNTVTCRRYMANGKRYEKVQTTQKPEPWLLIKM